MSSGISNDILYAVCRLEAFFVNNTSNDIQYRQGTCFFVVKDNKGYVITNRHLADLSKEDKKFSDYQLDKIRFDTRRYEEKTKKVISNPIEATSFLLTLPENEYDDVICFTNIRLTGKDTNVDAYFTFDMLADTNCLENDISVGDSVAVVGFPIVYDHLNNMPILRSGVISSDTRQNYSYDNHYLGHVIAYEAFSTGGLSGSPVLDLQEGSPSNGENASPVYYRPLKIVGINTGKIEAGGEHQHMSYMYKSDVIRDLILKGERGEGVNIVVNNRIIIKE